MSGDNLKHFFEIYGTFACGEVRGKLREVRGKLEGS